ncbi:MAG: chloride channel protein [Anaerolineae bacterium]|nr:chloride channel protein [Anaerolineae bacterium]
MGNKTPVLRSRASQFYRRLWTSETAVMVLMALLVGLGGGFGSVIFRWLINSFHYFFFDILSQWLSFMGPYYIIVVPALGGLIVGPLIHFLAREARGHGVPEVMEAIALRGGRIRPIVVLVKSLASSITIGSGGSVGREGPIVQIGSALGSTIGRVFCLSDERTKNLVACGAAAGIAATFNAPIAGVIFALEVILGEFGVTQFTTVVVASVTASVIGRIYFGNIPAFPIPSYAPVSFWELPIYAVLGLIAALVGVAYTRILYRFEDLFDAWRFPPYLKPAVGGLVIGLIGLQFPQIFGVGYESIEAVLHHELTLVTVGLLIVVKILATSITIGSGGSGGVFAPSLFIGAMLGGFFGLLVHQWMPQGTAVPAAYSLVGMSAVFAAAARAPITSILILFEMTQDYRIILPLMLATVLSTVIARHIDKESIYTLKLRRRGIDVYAGKNLNLMRTILVGEAMTPRERLTTVPPDMPLAVLARTFDETHHHGLAVVDENDILLGVVTLADLERAGPEALLTGVVRDICTKRVRTSFSDETLEDALRHFGALDVGRIPVVDRAKPTRLLGMLRRGDIIHAYSHAHLDHQARVVHMQRAQLEHQAGERAVEVHLLDRDQAVDKTIGELEIPADCIIASIRRGSRVLIPRGQTRLEAGDIVVALVADEQGEQELINRLRLSGTAKEIHA